ncbi:unnamed protein product, partial [Ectocarpus sp. 12 AP-2014]
YYIAEGVNGCFKDRVLCGVNFEPCPGAGDADEEDAVVMGPSGLPTDVVARKRLRSSLGPGDWLYFSQMGAYTASIA